jgi:uncharacterized HAD superfamily protein
MKQLVLAVDVDGVLADFTLGFYKLLAQWHPEYAVQTTAEQKTWDYANIAKDHEAETWTRLNQHATFWQDLPSRLTAGEQYKLISLCGEHRVYFVTNRTGVDPERQTVAWLRARGIYDPNVIVTPNKALAVRTVGASFAIDDKPGNILAMHPFTHTTLYGLQYNRSYTGPMDYYVTSLGEWIDFINGAANQRG